jgi:hypothetical protein
MRENGIDVRLHDARRSETRTQFPVLEQFDLNEGMLALWDGKWYHGDNAVLLISRLSKRAPLRSILKYEFASRWLYPVLRAGRNSVLKLRGRSPIN